MEILILLVCLYSQLIDVASLEKKISGPGTSIEV